MNDGPDVPLDDVAAGQSMPGFSFGANAVLKNPEVSAWLAAISNAWALVEAHLSDFVTYMVSEPSLTDTHRLIDPLGTELYQSFKNLSQRWDLLKTVMRLRLTKDEYDAIKTDFESLRRTIFAASEKRNDYVHSIYGYSEKHPDALQKSKPYSIMVDTFNPTLVTVEALMPVVQEISDAGEALQAFEGRVRRRRLK